MVVWYGMEWVFKVIWFSAVWHAWWCSLLCLCDYVIVVVSVVVVAVVVIVVVSVVVAVK